MYKWRLIIHPKQDGAMNMAIDEALLESVSNHLSPPTLRLYDWDPYTLSLGHAQSYREINIDEINKFKWDIVRRPTGGKAILHADELTYSVTAPDDDPITSGSVIESYRRISLGLLKGLEIIGIHADSKPKDTSRQSDSKSPVCFQYPSDYEITFQGKKLIGSAQARKKNGVLQHGAIPLFGDLSRIVLVLQYSSHKEKELAKKQLLSRATTIEKIKKEHISWDKTAEAVKKGFEEELNILFQQNDLSEMEKKRAQEICTEKYSHPEWTYRI